MHRKEYYKLSNLVVYLHAVVMFFPNKKVFLLPSGHSAYRTAILLLTIALVVVFFVERRPKDDVVIGISTSGNSKNVKLGMIMAQKMGAKTIGLLGNNGGTIKDVSDFSIIVNSDDTANIQESHRVIYHIICNLVEKQSSE